MKRDGALEQYLARHIEANLPAPPRTSAPWRGVLVLPAYRESPELLARLSRSLARQQRRLAILLLNRPQQDVDPAANRPLRQALERLPAGQPGCRQLAPGCDLFCHDLERLSGPTPGRSGVGLVRKIGCDIAIAWMAAGIIASDWICCTDGDATLPPDYFDRLADVPDTASAAVFPFAHCPGTDTRCDAATGLYELRLHHYVLGLEYAGSPFAYHTLGSSLAIRGGCYARVRGFPRRAGAEDFYLLNKANKIGPVARLGGEVIELRSRFSNRVPFGTGPAVEAIAGAGTIEQQARFYHPMCFEALRVFLSTAPDLRHDEPSRLADLLAERGLEPSAAERMASILQAMGLSDAIDHCRSHARSPGQFMRHFHQWFDAFRTLKCIHGLRDALWPDQSLLELGSLTPSLWPCEKNGEVAIDALRAEIRKHWQWVSPRHRDDW